MNGLCVETVTSGCQCCPVSSYSPAECGEDAFMDATSGGTSPSVSTDIEGACPQCGGEVIYSRTMVPLVDTTATALLAAIVSADDGFAEAAEAIDRGIIDQTTYQRAADRLEDAIAAARNYLENTAERF
jgi:hypothetical protein